MTRYDIRKDPRGWTVFDVVTDMPAEVDGYLQIEMDMEEADDLADLLNRIAANAETAGSH